MLDPGRPVAPAWMGVDSRARSEGGAVTGPSTRNSSRPPFVLVAAAIATISLIALPRIGAAASPAAPSGISFSSPVVVDPTHAYGEPDVKMDPSAANWYDSGPWGTGTQRSIWNWSTDGGHTFHSVHSPAVASPAESDTTVPCP